MVSSLFREISTSQYVPYFLMQKWGSIYHRYKNYINTGKDILESNTQKNGCLTTGITSTNITGLTTGFTTTNINGSQFFDNQNGLTYVTTIQNVKYTDYTDVGIHPYYDNIFYNVVNNNSFFTYISGNTSDYSIAIADGTLKFKKYEIIPSSKDKILILLLKLFSNK